MSIEVLTGKNTRWSYANVWEAKSINGSKPKYSVCLLIPKSDTATVKKIKAAIQQAYEEGASVLKGTGKYLIALDDPSFSYPLKDGDAKKNAGDEYKGCYYINAKSDNAPAIVDSNQKLIMDHSEVYSGVYGYASINFFAFNKTGNKGISVGLQGLMKVRDGEPLGGKKSIESMFGGIETEEDEDFLS